MSLWLTPEELEELTGYKTSRRQKLALGELKIPFRSRPADGFPLVLRDQFESLTEQQKLRAPHRRAEPRLDLADWVQQPKK